MKDTYGRKIDYLRISITDRCNLRCRYCMPCDIALADHSEILSYEELLHLCRIGVQAGIHKIKVTGGEPLVRLGCMEFLRELKAVEGISSVTITTNGVELLPCLDQMKSIGLDGINISLDSLDPERFARITQRDRFLQVWESVMAAVDMGLRVKINCVPMDGLSEKELLAFARLAADYPLDVRFIEMMPIGFGGEFQPVKGSDIREFLNQHFLTLTPVTEVRGNGPARYYRGEGMKGCIGFIEAVHNKFCDTCNRVRMTADGWLKPCLYYEHGVDLRTPLRTGASDARLLGLMEEGIRQKPMEHHFGSHDAGAERKRMSQIGG